MTIRSGVKWSDGTPFSANDVALHLQCVEGGSGARSQRTLVGRQRPAHQRRAGRTDQVVFTFNAPAQTYFYYVADQTSIVPQHIWGSMDQSKLDTYADTHPGRHRPVPHVELRAEQHQVPAQHHYWQSTPGHPVPQVAEVDYPAFLGNTPANL